MACKYINITQLVQFYSRTKNTEQFNMEALTEQAIYKMMQIQNGMNESFIVDISKPKKLKAKLKAFTIEDGTQRYKGFIEINQPAKDIEKLMKQKKKTTLRVKIREHIFHMDEACIEIVTFEMTGQPKHVEIKQEYHRSIKLENEYIKQQAQSISHPPVDLQYTSLRDYRQQSLCENSLADIIKENLRNNSATKPTSRKLKIQNNCDNSDEDTREEAPMLARDNLIYQRISDLYESYYHWTLIVRVIDSNYKQFISKQGKLIKLLTVDLIDREGMMITGNFFGDKAFDKFNSIKSGKIYRIARGKVMEDKFNTHKKEKQSKFCIQFSYQSEFAMIDDDPQIPYSRSNLIRLDELSNRLDPNDTYNIIAILAQIQDPREIPREDKKIILQVLRVGDPLTKVVNQVTIWSNQITVDPSLVGKSVLLKKFKVNRYRQQLTLSSTVNSQILCHNFFANHEGSCNFFINPRQNNSPIKTLKQLADELHYNTANVPIVSTVYAWVKEMGFDKKWFYDACPNPRCRRSCSSKSSNVCQHCSCDVSQCNKRYILQVKLTDTTGSIWVTAFDQSANVFLKETPMELLFPMSNKQLCEYAEHNYCYEQYRVQISSKRDMLGLSKHTILGKPVSLDIAAMAQTNLKRIMSLGRELGVLGLE